MLQHHIQKSIINKLAFSDSLRFSELKPENIENKLFDYHLKIVVNDGLVEKDAEGHYILTSKGKFTGSQLQRTDISTHETADSVLFLVVRRKSDNSWLLYRRLTHPLKNKTGFMHTIPNTTEPTTTTARNVLRSKTGLEGDFSYRGSGYFRIFDNGELESFTHFTLLVSENAQGLLESSDERAEYSWIENPDFSSAEMLPNMQTLHQQYRRNENFYLEETLNI